MIVKVFFDAPALGYVAGTGAGIASINGQGTIAQVLALHAVDLSVLGSAWSLENGHYLIRALDPSQPCLIVGRDPNGHYEPVAYDWVRPMADLTAQAQADLWAEMLRD